MQKNTGYVYISLFSVFLCLIRNFSNLYASFKAKDKSSGEYSPFYPRRRFYGSVNDFKNNNLFDVSKTFRRKIKNAVLY
jgi:hypothetical protein